MCEGGERGEGREFQKKRATKKSRIGMQVLFFFAVRSTNKHYNRSYLHFPPFCCLSNGLPRDFSTFCCAANGDVITLELT